MESTVCQLIFSYSICSRTKFGLDLALYNRVASIIEVSCKVRNSPEDSHIRSVIVDIHILRSYSSSISWQIIGREGG